MKLPGTIYTAAEEIEAAGGKALALQVDIRDEDQVQRPRCSRRSRHFGGIDILVNNASAISLHRHARDADEALRPDVRRQRARHLRLLAGLPAAPQEGAEPAHPHALAAAQPRSALVRAARRLHDGQVRHEHVRARHGRGVRGDGIAVNALWPRTVIATAALVMLGGVTPPERCRKPEIVADAAHAILTRDSRGCTGHFFIDDDVLREAGVTDFETYAVAPGQPLLPDLFLGEPPAEYFGEVYGSWVPQERGGAPGGKTLGALAHCSARGLPSR